MDKKIKLTIMRNIQLILLLLTAINISALPQKRPEDNSLLKPYGDEAFNAIQEFFKYDKGIPLDTKIIDVQDKGTYKLEKFIFTNSKKNLVPGYLAIPKLDKP